MQNDEIQEDVTLENNVEEEVEETVDEQSEADDSTDAEAELAKARAAAKKWEAIAKRKAKKAEEAGATQAPASPAQLDQELINLTYKNYLGGLGITNPSVQDEAINLAKKMGMAVSQIQSDPAVMEILQTKQKMAVANSALAKGTGGSALRKKDVDYLASQVAQGKSIEKISGKDAVALLKKLKNS
jgi:regulator of protease activity HflC (stomatin/prohibitin superfamily)